jgi:hypothetical protein
LLIWEISISIVLKNSQITVISIASVAVLLTLSAVSSNLDVLEAYAGITLSNDNVAKTIQVRVNPAGTNLEKTFDSFSRIGFVSGESNFLLESVPSKDKKPFYDQVKKSLESKNTNLKNKGMHISIDIFSGDGEIIETLIYRDCDVTEYFVHGVDSRGKIFFVENEGEVEIREVTKFDCVSFTLEIDYTEEEIKEIKQTITKLGSIFETDSDDPYFSTPQGNGTEGELFYNSDTNRLQKFLNGAWVDISGVGGPPSPRR